MEGVRQIIIPNRQAAGIKTKNSKLVDRAITDIICIGIVLSYVMLLFTSDADEANDNIVVLILKYINLLSFCLLLILCWNRVKEWKRLALLILILYMIVRTVIFARTFALININLPALTAILIYSDILRTKSDIKRIGLTSVIMFLFVYLTSYYNHDGYYLSYVFPQFRLNRNPFGIIINMNLYAVLKLVTKRNRKIMPIHLLIYAIALYMIIDSGSRTSLAATVLIILFHMICIKKRTLNKRRLLGLFAFTLLLSMLGPVLITKILAPMFNTADRSLFSSREILYEGAFRALSSGAAFLFGFGFNDFMQFGNGDLGRIAHNQWLQYAVNYGILFTIFVAVIYWRVISTEIKKCRNFESLFFVFLQIVLLVCSITETIYMNYQAGYIVLSVILMGYTADNPGKIRHQDKNRGYKTATSSMDCYG